MAKLTGPKSGVAAQGTRAERFGERRVGRIFTLPTSRTKLRSVTGGAIGQRRGHGRDRRREHVDVRFAQRPRHVVGPEIVLDGDVRIDGLQAEARLRHQLGEGTAEAAVPDERNRSHR